MKGNLVKLALAVVTAIVLVALVSMFVTGFMSAYKPGNKTATTSGSAAAGAGVAARGGGGAASQAAPLPSPAPSLYPGMAAIPAQVAQPQAEVSLPSGQPAIGAQPSPEAPSLYPPAAATQVPGPAGEFPDISSPGFLPGRGWSWFTASPTPKPVSTPAPQPAASQPVFSSYEEGWRQVILRLLEIVPLIFPGCYPGMQWYAWPSI